MKTARTRRHFCALRLTALESRLVPAGANSLLSTSDAGLLAVGGGGTSAMGSFRGIENPTTTHPRAQFASSDGRFTVFTNTAANLVPGQSDFNNDDDVFLYDRLVNTTTLVSHAAGGSSAAGNQRSINPSISTDGRFVAFESIATDLVPAFVDSNGLSLSDVYLFDRVTGSISLVSHTTTSTTAGGSDFSIAPAINDDGRIISYSSRATDLVAGFVDSDMDHQALTTDVFAFDRIAGTNQLVSHRLNSLVEAGRFPSWVQDISGDGRFILWGSFSSDIVSATSSPSRSQLYVYDNQTSTNELITRATGQATTPSNGTTNWGAISRDGRYVVFDSNATNMVPGYVAGTPIPSSYSFDLYVFDRQSSAAKLISGSGGSTTLGSNGQGYAPLLSDDGRFIAFQSDATDIVAGISDTNSGTDVFLYDQMTGTSRLVSQAFGVATTGGAESFCPAISGDGRFVVFSSGAGDLVSGAVMPNAPENDGVFLYDATFGTIRSIARGNRAAIIDPTHLGSLFTVSADGQIVSFVSDAANLVQGVIDTNGAPDIFLYDRDATSLTMASRAATPSQSGGGISKTFQTFSGNVGSIIVSKSVSDDGRFVVYTSLAANLVAGQIDSNFATDVFLHDRVLGTTLLVSHNAGGLTLAGDQRSCNPKISGDGRFVIYVSYATNLVGGFVDGNGPGGGDLYLFDRLTGTNVLVSHSASGAAISGSDNSDPSTINDSNYAFDISADGRIITYSSYANDLVAGFVNLSTYRGDIFVYDRVANTNALVSHDASSPNVSGNNDSFQTAVSADGKFIAFTSNSSNLLPGQTWGFRNVYVYDVLEGTSVLVSHDAGSLFSPGNGGASHPAINSDGRFITYNSAANTIVTGGTDPNNANDVFLYDRVTETSVLVSHVASSQVSAGQKRSESPVITPDGRFITYQSGSNDLVAGFVDGNANDFYGGLDVFVYDRITGINTLASQRSGMTSVGGNGSSSVGTLSNDGRFITYTSNATDLIANMIDGYFAGGGSDGLARSNVYLFDQLTGTTTLLSHSLSNTSRSANGISYAPVVSRDGSIVYFGSNADDLVAGDFNGADDIFAYVQRPPTVQAVQFGDGGNQRSLVKQIVVTFSEPVRFSGSVASAFTVRRTGTGGTVGDVTLSATPASGPTSSVTITFSGSLTEYGSLVDGLYDLWINPAQVSGTFGLLDGNNDGVAGGSYHLVGTTVNGFYRLFGDANGDGTVSQGQDFAAFRLAFLSGPSVVFDFDGDGQVGQLDFSAFRLRFLSVP